MNLMFRYIASAARGYMTIDNLKRFVVGEFVVVLYERKLEHTITGKINLK
jgi:hypothetical protein